MAESGESLDPGVIAKALENAQEALQLRRAYARRILVLLFAQFLIADGICS
jgi:hypothetical protein